MPDKPPIRLPTVKVEETLSQVQRTENTSCILWVIGLFGLLGIVLALILPAMQSAGRGRRLPCSNNLKQIALAFHQYHDQHGSFPPAYINGPDGRPWHSWRVLILPYLEEHAKTKGAGALYEAYQFAEPWYGANNIRLAEKMPAVYRCSEQPETDPQSHTRYVLPVGEETIWPEDSGVSFRDMTDGSSNLIAVVEADTSVHWLAPRDTTLNDVVAMLEDRREPPHLGGRFAALADGSVRFISDTMSLDTLRKLLLRADGEPVGDY